MRWATAVMAWVVTAHDISCTWILLCLPAHMPLSSCALLHITCVQATHTDTPTQSAEQHLLAPLCSQMQTGIPALCGLPLTLQVDHITLLDEELFDTQTVWLEDPDRGVLLEETTLRDVWEQYGFITVPTTNIKAATSSQSGPRSKSHA